MFDYEDVCYDYNGEGDNVKYIEVNLRLCKFCEIVGMCICYFF